MKLAIDTGNSSVKGNLLTNDNKLIKHILIPSAVNNITDEKYLTFDNNEVYFKVIDSSLNHFDDITCVGDYALAKPNYKEYDVTSSSYKSNHKITTALLFGSFIDEVNENTTLTVTASVPIVEAKTLGLIDKYTELLKGKHKLIKYTKDGSKEITITIKIAKVLNEGQAGFFGMLDENNKDFKKTLMSLYKCLGEKESPIKELEDFVIVDIGEGTTDLAVFRNKKFNADFSYSVTKGFGNLLEDAMKKAQQESLTIESRKDLQKLLESNNPRRAKRKEMWLEYIEPTRKEFIELITDTLLKTYGNRDFFDAIIFLGGGFSALTGYMVENGEIVTDDYTLFESLEEKLEQNKKTADLIFGIPKPYSQTINDRGLTQVLANLK